MDISLIKQHLAGNTFEPTKPFLILADMTGPIAHANGHVIESRSRRIERDWDEKQVAEAIYRDADWIAFYEILDNPNYLTLRAAMGKMYQIGLAEEPKPLDLKLIKQHLQENQFATKKTFLILNDLTGPVGLINGYGVDAKSRAIPRDWDERQVAESIHAEAEWVAFYKSMDIPSHSHTHIRAAFGKLSEIGL